jgi:hypothetical protein
VVIKKAHNVWNTHTVEVNGKMLHESSEILGGLVRRKILVFS